MTTTAANTSGNLTLMDWAKRLDPNGAMAKIAEVLQPMNAFVQDAVFRQGNLETGHRFTSRTALPAVSRRRFNQGITPTKSKTDQVTETCTYMAGMSKVDSAEAALSGDAAAFRASEDVAFVQSFNKQAEDAFVYDNSSATPDNMMGFAPRFNSTTGAGGKQIVLHDGSASGGDQTSMWLIGWGDETVFGIFPKGTKAGLSARNLGERLVTDPDGGEYPALCTWWEWYLGLCVKDWRYIARIANIDTSALAQTGMTLIQSSIAALYKIYKLEGVRLAWYTNRLVAEYLHHQAVDSVKQSTLRIENIGGEPITMLHGIPVRRSDSITNTEAVIS